MMLMVVGRRSVDVALTKVNVDSTLMVAVNLGKINTSVRNFGCHGTYKS